MLRIKYFVAIGLSAALLAGSAHLANAATKNKGLPACRCKLSSKTPAQTPVPATKKNVACGDTWKTANLTVFESYPAPDSNECIESNGCQWAGQFAGLNGKQTEEWVKNNNIAAVHSDDFAALKGKTIRIRKGDKTIDAVVYDMCADSDCDGCCTQNLGSEGFLIDLEKYTAARLGATSGTVEWQACQ